MGVRPQLGYVKTCGRLRRNSIRRSAGQWTYWTSLESSVVEILIVGVMKPQICSPRVASYFAVLIDFSLNRQTRFRKIGGSLRCSVSLVQAFCRVCANHGRVVSILVPDLHPSFIVENQLFLTMAHLYDNVPMVKLKKFVSAFAVLQISCHTQFST